MKKKTVAPKKANSGFPLHKIIATGGKPQSKAKPKIKK